MPTLDKTIDNVLEENNHLQKLLIGGILMFIPIVNIFALGYIFRAGTNMLRNSGKFSLPEWNNWPALFIDGLKLVVISILYAGVPMALAWVISIFLNTITMKMLGPIPFFPISIAFLIVPALKYAALYHFQKTGSWESLLDLKEIANLITTPYKRHLAIPSIALVGLFFIGAPLFGLAFFLGMLLILPYYYGVYSSSAQTVKKSSTKK